MNAMLKSQGVLLIIFSMLTITAFSQTGPGGVLSTDSMEGWWLSDSSVYSDAGTTLATNSQTVQRWNDITGSHQISQSISSNRPTFNTGALNGFPAVRFDGSNDFLVTSLGSGNFTSGDFFIVASFNQANQSAGDNDFLYQLGTNNTPLGNVVSLSRSASDHSSGADNILAFVENQVLAGSPININAHVFTQSFTNSSPFHRLKVDGTDQSISSSVPISVPRNLYFGRFHYYPLPHYLNGDIYEFIMYNSTLNQTQTSLVENHLAAKYGFNLSANDFYSFESTHPNELAGIGQESSTDNHTDAQGTGIVRISTPSSLNDGDYMLWGHNDGALASQTSEFPAALISDGWHSFDT